MSECKNCKNKCSNNVTSEKIMKNCKNRFEYVNSLIDKVYSELYLAKSTETLDNHVNIAAEVIDRAFCENCNSESDNNKV